MKQKVAVDTAGWSEVFDVAIGAADLVEEDLTGHARLRRLRRRREEALEVRELHEERHVLFGISDEVAVLELRREDAVRVVVDREERVRDAELVERAVGGERHRRRGLRGVPAHVDAGLVEDHGARRVPTRARLHLHREVVGRDHARRVEEALEHPRRVGDDKERRHDGEGPRRDVDSQYSKS